MNGSYDDEYTLEDIDVLIADYMQRIVKQNFAAAWDEIGPEFEFEETYVLSSFKTLEEAVKNITNFLGMQPCERSDKIQEGKNSHTLYLSGIFRDNHEVLAKAKLAALSCPSSGITMKLSVRCTNLEIATFIASAVV